MEYVVCAVLGYLLGTISPAAFFSKIKHVNLREQGSGNVGGSNTFLVIGKSYGIFVMLFDITKAVAASWLARFLFPELALAGLLTGLASIIGHIFPFYMHFKGGKGLATFGGMILAVDWKIFCGLLVVAGSLILITSRSVAAPVSASVLFPALLWLQTGSRADLAVALAASVLILIAHRENIKMAFIKADMPVRAYIKSKFISENRQ